MKEYKTKTIQQRNVEHGNGKFEANSIVDNKFLTGQNQVFLLKIIHPNTSYNVSIILRWVSDVPRSVQTTTAF